MLIAIALAASLVINALMFNVLRSYQAQVDELESEIGQQPSAVDGTVTWLRRAYR